jgi:hypothetical protein
MQFTKVVIIYLFSQILPMELNQYCQLWIEFEAKARLIWQYEAFGITDFASG